MAKAQLAKRITWRMTMYSERDDSQDQRRTYGFQESLLCRASRKFCLHQDLTTHYVGRKKCHPHLQGSSRMILGRPPQIHLRPKLAFPRARGEGGGRAARRQLTPTDLRFLDLGRNYKMLSSPNRLHAVFMRSSYAFRQTRVRVLSYRCIGGDAWFVSGIGLHLVI